MNNKQVVIGLVLLNLGVFFATAAFLPHVGIFICSNYILDFFRAPNNWDIAVGTAFGSTLFSTGAVFLIAHFLKPKQI